MDVVEADVTGLSEFAASCGRLAGALREAGAAPPVGPSCQASSAAVAELHGAADVLEDLLAIRLKGTGRAAGRAAQGYAATDANNAASIGAVWRALR